MSTVTLQAIWVNLAADPSDYRELPYVTAYSASTEAQVSVRDLVNRVRVVRRSGGVTTTPLQVTGEVTRGDVEWLSAHVGETMCFRDDVGRKVFGVYASVPVTEDTTFRDRPSVSLSVQSISFSEAT